MQTLGDKEWFIDRVHEALASLYDPLMLRKSPLIGLLGLDQRHNIVLSLRDTLGRAVESLQPNAHTPRDSKVWRTYHILRRRYIEQVTQRELSLELGLSIRQLQRAEAQARETLADYLWDMFSLEARAPHFIAEHSESELESPSLEDIPTREQELEHLRQSTQEHAADVNVLVADALKTIQPLVESMGAVVDFTTSAVSTEVYVQPPIFRQALIHLLSAALSCVPNHNLRLEVKAEAHAAQGQLALYIRSQAGKSGESQAADYLDSLEMAQHLIHMCGGEVSVNFNPQQPTTFTATVTLPIEAPMSVMVIDDNADTRLLYQRYLSGTRYRFLGAPDCPQGLAAALQERPKLIVLDVMMPGQDGWALLGQLREHPETENIPVVVCTILAQENLAYALGAAKFIRKPVNREQFLSTLDQQLLAQESG